MTETINPQEKHGFQAEVKQLLHLMVHSLYSNKEIFIRELISNASDACDKLRFEALANDALYEGDSELNIRLEADKDAKTLTITDNGIGMSHDEVIQNLGTIAKSGTKEFLASLTGDNAKDASLIGQFGVGFYSAFIVADEVTVLTRKAGTTTSEAVLWKASAEGEYTIEPSEKAGHGTQVTLHLKEEENEFLEDYRLRNIITKYSDHISFPVMMQELAMPTEEEGKEGESADPKLEQVNKATALWTRPKSELNAEEYQAFYKHVSHDFEEPLAWTHNKVEGKLDYTLLLYLPKKPPFDMWQRDLEHGLKLYVQRVFIMDKVEQFLPLYLRFIKGIVDTSDLPLNVSREILQESKEVESIRAAVTKRTLDMLEKIAKTDKEEYQQFWDAFGLVLKEGPAEDFANKDRIAKLLRFSTTKTDAEKQEVSLDEYVLRMQPNQKKIYYVSADSFHAAKNSPHLEYFRKEGIEVLLLSDRVDEWLMANMREYDGKAFASVAQGELDLDESGEEKQKEAVEKLQEEHKDFLARVKASLNEKVSDVRMTQRLTSSPACVVADEHGMTAQMERIMRSVGQAMPNTKPILELNPEHELVKKMEALKEDEKLNRWASVIFQQATLAEGAQLDDPASFVKELNELLLELSK